MVVIGGLLTRRSKPRARLALPLRAIDHPAVSFTSTEPSLTWAPSSAATSSTVPSNGEASDGKFNLSHQFAPDNIWSMPRMASNVSFLRRAWRSARSVSCGFAGTVTSFSTRDSARSMRPIATINRSSAMADERLIV
eukprot:gene61814-84529_t